MTRSPKPTLSLEEVSNQVILALQHVEAEDGLYLDNFYHLHEEDERPPVTATPEQIFEALQILISDRKVRCEGLESEKVYKLL